jgi:hypothetical protein
MRIIGRVCKGILQTGRLSIPELGIGMLIAENNYPRNGFFCMIKIKKDLSLKRLGNA